MGYKDVPNFNTMKVIKADEPKKIVLTKLSRRTKILAYGIILSQKWLIISL